MFETETYPLIDDSKMNNRGIFDKVLQALADTQPDKFQAEFDEANFSLYFKTPDSVDEYNDLIFIEKVIYEGVPSYAVMVNYHDYSVDPSLFKSIGKVFTDLPDAVKFGEDYFVSNLERLMVLDAMRGSTSEVAGRLAKMMEGKE